MGALWCCWMRREPPALPPAALGLRRQILKMSKVWVQGFSTWQDELLLPKLEAGGWGWSPLVLWQGI